MNLKPEIKEFIKTALDHRKHGSNSILNEMFDYFNISLELQEEIKDLKEIFKINKDGTFDVKGYSSFYNENSREDFLYRHSFDWGWNHTNVSMLDGEFIFSVIIDGNTYSSIQPTLDFAESHCFEKYMRVQSCEQHVFEEKVGYEKCMNCGFTITPKESPLL